MEYANQSPTLKHTSLFNFWLQQKHKKKEKLHRDKTESRKRISDFPLEKKILSCCAPQLFDSFNKKIPPPPIPPPLPY